MTEGPWPRALFWDDKWSLVGCDEGRLGSGGSSHSLDSREDWEQTEMKMEKKDTDLLERDAHI